MTSLNELLFFKVIKNIFLFKKILSFLKTTPKNKIRNDWGIYTYDQIISVEWIISKNYYGLLLDKVMRNQYLEFNCTGETIKRFTTKSKYDNYYPKSENSKEKEITFYKHSIFNLKADYQFYSTLFKNYKLYFQMSQTSSIKSIEFNSIEYDNVSSLSVLIKEYGYKPTILTFIHSIDIGSFSIADYLFDIEEIQQQLKDHSIIEKIWITSITISNRLNEIPLLLKRLSYLIKKQQLKLILTSTSSISIFYLVELVSTIKIHEETISNFLNLCEIIIILTSNFNSYKQSILSNFNNSISQEYQMIKNDNQFTEFPTEIELSELRNQIKTNTSTIISKNIKTLLNCQIFNKFYKMFIKFTCKSIDCNLQYFKKANQQDIENTKPTTAPFNSFLKLIELIETNDLNQIKIQYNESDILNLPNGFNQRDAYKKVSISIKSIEMFDLLFNLNVFSILNTTVGQTEEINYNILLSSIVYNYELSNHFKTNYTKQYLKSTIQDFPTYSFNSLSLDKYKFIFENWLDFSKFHSAFINVISLCISLKQVTISDYKKFIQLILTKNSNNNEVTQLIPFFNNQIQNKPSKLTLEQLEYVFKICPDLKPTRFLISIMPTVLIHKYQIGDIDYILSIFDRNDITGDPFKFLIEQISKTNDLEFLNLLIIQTQNKTTIPFKFNEFISNLLYSSIKSGHFIKIHQFLSSPSLNFSIDQLLTNQLKNRLIETAYSNGKIEIFIYLLDQLNFGPNFPHYNLKLDVNNNNCFHNEFIKNKLINQ